MRSSEGLNLKGYLERGMAEITGFEGVQWNVTALHGCATRQAVRMARLQSCTRFFVEEIFLRAAIAEEAHELFCSFAVLSSAEGYAGGQDEKHA
jgi:hypothetical protein